MTNPILARITVYPIKSLDGITVTSCECLEHGALAFDRRYAIRTADGRFLNAKRTARIHRLSAEFDLDAKTVRLGDRTHDLTSEFPLAIECEPLDRFLSDFFDQTVTLVENEQCGFPDDTDAAGPTVVSEATLKTVAGWFEALTVAEARRRFRANLEVAGVESFWEDWLYTSDGGIAFQIGTVRFFGVKPCRRCVVPTRSADSGEVTAGFVDDFRRHRELTLPYGVAANRFDHHYRLAVNTIGAEGVIGQELTTGDPITVRRDESQAGR